MRYFSKKELDEILAKHKKWLKGEKGGERANFRNADLGSVDFSNANLTDVDFRNANLNNADFSGARLIDVNFRNTILRGADFSSAYLLDADFRYADLREANFDDADLCDAILNDADLRRTRNLDTVDYSHRTSMFALNCPEEGSFIGFKQADRIIGDGDYKTVIVKLRITEDAKRSSGTTRKCRCSKAVVLGFYDLKHNELPNDILVESKYVEGFYYRVGEIVEPSQPFEENRWVECASGIHFFMTFDEAVKY